MESHQLSHVMRAAAGISGCREFFLVGSQAILICAPNAPISLLKSCEIDVWMRVPDEVSDVVEGAIGKGSQFEMTFGYHIDVVSAKTAILPKNWEQRAVTVRDYPGADGLTLTSPSVPDLAASKLAAGRDKDIEWVRLLISEGGVSEPELDAVIGEIVSPEAREKAMLIKTVVFRSEPYVPGW